MNIDPQNIWIFSAIDKLISQNKKTPALVIGLFEKKQLMLQLLQTKKIDAHKYKTLVGKAYKQEAGIVKACAEEDIRILTNPKDEKAVDAWFRQIVEKTGAPYENQKKLYQFYKNQSAPPPPSISPQQPPKNIQPVQPKPQPQEVKKPEPKPIAKPIQPPKPQVKSGEGEDDIVSFKSLDNLLEEYEGPPEKYQKLLSRKKKLLELVNRKELTAEKYKNTLEVYCKRLAGTDFATDYKFELDGIADFHEGNVQSWFSEILEETQFSLQMQNEKAKTLKKGAPNKKVPETNNYRESIRESVKTHPKAVQSSGFDIGVLNSFRIFDQQMERQTDNKVNYGALLDKKKKFLDQAKKGSLTGQKYRTLLIKSISEATNEDIKDAMKFQLEELGQFHGNNVESWWQDILSNADLMLDSQEKTLKDLIQGKKIQNKIDSDDDDNLMKFINGEDDDDLDDEPAIKSQPKKEAQKQVLKKEEQKQIIPKEETSQHLSASKGGMDCSNIFSLKTLDQLMSENEKNPSTFCALFERKQAIFGMMQKGEIDANKYKVLQEKGLSSAPSEKIKQCIQMDLFDLKDMYSGDVNEWFKSLIEDTGLSYDDQQELYNKLKTKAESSGPQKSQPPSKGQARGSVEIKENPNISQVVCFTSVFKLFKKCLKNTDILYYKQLSDKRIKLMDLVNQKKLIPQKYKEINEKAGSKTQNMFLRDFIQEELVLLKTKFKGNEEQWFTELKQYLFLEPPELKIPENSQMKKINALSAQEKVQYLARKMSPFQNFLSFHRSNVIPDENLSLDLYAKSSKKEAFKAIALLKKDPNLDIYNLAEKLFPQITTDIFYGNLQGLKKKAEACVGSFVNEIAALKDYGSKIKKATNPNNLENIKKQISECQANIAYLQSWPGKELVPFPIITQQKIEKYNLDLNTHLDVNEVQIIVTHIQGLQSDSYLKIYAGEAKNERFWVKVRDGPQKEVKVVIKLTPKEATDLIRGDKPVIMLRLFDKSFWGNFTLLGECPLLGTFIRNNIAENKVSDGRHTITFEMRVYKPSKPLVTEIMHITLKKLPAFKPDPKTEKLVIKQCLAYFSE